MNNNTEVYGGGGLMMIIDVGDTLGFRGHPFTRLHLPCLGRIPPL
jgi:hypothetical protein